jgi:hypothetical protein
MRFESSSGMYQLLTLVTSATTSKGRWNSAQDLDPLNVGSFTTMGWFLCFLLLYVSTERVQKSAAFHFSMCGLQVASSGL